MVNVDAEVYSDYDILIILNVNYNWNLKKKIYDLMYKIDLEYNIIKWNRTGII